MANAEPLETWAVATFNVVTVSLVLVLLGHLSGVLTDVLQGFGTVQGMVVFGYLWTLVVVSTRWALADGGLARIRTDGVSSLVMPGAIAGALTGAGFLLGVILAGGLVGLLTGRVELVSFGLVVLFGGASSALVGATLGIVFAIVDAVFYRTAIALAPGSTG